jgi:hypothetical protein
MIYSFRNVNQANYAPSFGSAICLLPCRLVESFEIHAPELSAVFLHQSRDAQFVILFDIGHGGLVLVPRARNRFESSADSNEACGYLNSSEHLCASSTKRSTRSKSRSRSQHHGQKGGIAPALRVPRTTKPFFFSPSGAAQVLEMPVWAVPITTTLPT